MKVEETVSAASPERTDTEQSHQPANPSPTSSNTRYWIILAALVVAMAAQMWTSIRQLSITSDEIDHVHAGYRYLQCNDYGWNPEHPPLVKEIAAVPLLFMHINDPVPNACGLPNSKGIDFRVGHDFIFFNPEAMLTRARMAASVFALLLLVATWLFARKLFGMQVATIAAILIAFEPSLVGHGSLVATDVPAALGFVLALYALCAYVVEPSFGRLLVVGFATGFAFCLKHSAVLLVIITPTLLIGNVLLRSSPDRLRRFGKALGALALIAVISLIALWASYGFRYAARPGSAEAWRNPRWTTAKGKVATAVIPVLMERHLLPEGYLIGLQDVLVESEFGRFSYLFGKLYWGGKPIYFPAAAVVKLTLPLLFFLVISAAAWPFWKEHLREFMFLLFPTVLIFAVSSVSGLNIGFRHVFTAVPLMVLFGAAGAWSISQRWRWAEIGVFTLLIWHAASSLHVYPNYLSYANELFGGPFNAYKYLADSNVDWGQAQKMAREYVISKRPTNCFFVRAFNNFNSDYAIPCGGISELEHNIPPTPFTGTLIVSSNVLAGITDYAGGGPAAQIFKDRLPVSKLGGGALLVYEGTFDLQPIVTEQRLQTLTESGYLNAQTAIPQVEAIAASDPTDAHVRLFLCDAYGLAGRYQDAVRECNLALDLAYQDPASEALAKQIEATLKLNRLPIHHPHQ